MSALPNRDRRAERREATRREILGTAWEIARRDGLAAVTLREVAQRIGMRSPSLYTHFDSKNAIYDAMFAQAWTEFAEMFDALELPAGGREALLTGAEAFFDFAVADLARYQLMNQRTIPGFRPSEQAFEASLTAYERMRAAMAARGVHDQADLDLWTAMLGGFVDQQLANDPGGTRWRRQLPRLVDMYCDEVGAPSPRAGGNR
ncbi:MAG TPA: TetR/AcrR family transcriptional regulator [Streptosporangiaceae bacterium]